jgi:acetyl esterase
MYIKDIMKYPTVTDPGMRAFLAEGERLYPDNAVDFSLAEQRDFYTRYCQHFAGKRPASIETEDFKVGDVPCRRYLPPKPAGKLLYLHGGGFVVGGLDSHDAICADIADQTGLEVTAVEYRLAPEHPFPAAFDDCWAVLKTIGTCVVAGDSAGGNLAAALCLKARDASGPSIKGQVLIYPGLGGDMTKGSYITQAEAPGLTTKDVIYYRETNRGGHSPFAEPLRATSHANLPQAFLVACGLDPLHDDCFDYAGKLRANGVSAEVRDEPLLIHAFLRARNMSEPAAKSFAAIIAAIKRFAA